MNSFLVTSVLDMLLAGLLGKVPNFNDDSDGNGESDNDNDERDGGDDNNADYEDVKGG